MIRRLVTTVCSLAAGAVLVTAQATTAPPAGAGQGQQAPTFRSRIDSISVDVSVTDKDGRPVTDLKATISKSARPTRRRRSTRFV
jgi:hypothetical protein